MYYKICSKCGAHLDPGEQCDCVVEKKRRRMVLRRNVNNYRKHVEERTDERTAV